jgi:hypothetical protein
MIPLLAMLLAMACAQDSAEPPQQVRESAEGDTMAAIPADTAPSDERGAVRAMAHPEQALHPVSLPEPPEPPEPPELVPAVPDDATIEQRVDSQIDRVDALIEAMHRLAEQQPEGAE